MYSMFEKKFAAASTSFSFGTFSFFLTFTSVRAHFDDNIDSIFFLPRNNISHLNVNWMLLRLT
jgi:hypothetical protein